MVGLKSKVKKPLGSILAVLLFTTILLTVTLAPAVNAQTETNYVVQSQPDPLVDGTSRIGSTSSPLANAQTQDYTYEDISEANTGTSTTTTYDFSSGAGTNKWAKTNNDVDEASAPYTTTHFDGSPPEGAWTEITYANVQSLNQVWQLADGTTGDYAALQYKLTITESASTITNIDITQTVYIQTAGTTLGVWVWNFNTSAWVQVGTNYTVNSTASPGETFTRFITSGFSNYINASGLMYVIVVANTANKDYNLDYIKFDVTYTPLDHRLSWEHRVTGIGAHDSYRVRIYGYADAGETFSIYVWGAGAWVDNGYNLPVGAGAWVDYQIPSSWISGGAVSIKFDDDTNGDTTVENIHIDYCSVRGTTAEGFDFSVRASPPSLTITQGENTTTTISATLVSGSTQTVNLSGSWVGTTPSGVTTSFSLSSGAPTFSSVLTFTTTGSASTGTFTYRVTGQGASLTRTTDVILTINEAAAFNFSVTASPENLLLARDNTAASTITVQYIAGTTASVSLSGSWIGTTPTGISASFNPTSGTPVYGTPFTSTLTFTASSTASGGMFTYRVTGTSGSATRTDDITVKLIPLAPSLTSPENATTTDSQTPTFDWVDVSGATSYTITVATDNNFTYTVFTTTTIVSTVTSTTTLSYGTQYYWKVRATGDAGTGSWSPAYNFTVKATVAKIVSSEINAGVLCTNSTAATITLSAQNAAEISLSSDGVLWENWQPYATSIPYTF